MIGKIVVCRYNNNCYKVDDVNFESDPLDTFNCRGKLVRHEKVNDCPLISLQFLFFKLQVYFVF